MAQLQDGLKMTDLQNIKADYHEVNETEEDIALLGIKAAAAESLAKFNLANQTVDNFDFGEDELELKKLELNVDDMETANEYEDFLNAFFENSTIVGSNSRSQSGTLTNKYSKKHKIKSNSKPKK